ncbi:hypothetical protein [Microbacterium sp. MYb62]|uniref:hypothetical protein n=1 Tax=Microbacterium sp. MYb62 TaxID=1848690 RepID=UPI000CFBB03F|nr:hypothetical protein [Microbacterium sp. MYb62]PRB18431.1 hypothetical protein CQ042_03850 [Microbacterium sp. MYb62]
MTPANDPAAWRERLAAIRSELDELFPPGEAEDAEEAFAAQARAGALGREWQVLQGRIDLNLTTREAVLSGEDDSVEAAFVRETGARQSEALVDALRRSAPGDPRDPGAELRALHAETTERGARIQEMLRDMAARERRI